MTTIRETEKAGLVTMDEPSSGVWLPRTEIEINETGIGGILTVTLPEWLAMDKGLI